MRVQTEGDDRWRTRLARSARSLTLFVIPRTTFYRPRNLLSSPIKSRFLAPLGMTVRGRKVTRRQLMANIGFIGLGIMGSPMAGHLIKGGHRVFLHSRRGVPPALTDAGGIACSNSGDVAQKADVVILMVPDTPHVEAVLFGEHG